MIEDILKVGDSVIIDIPDELWNTGYRPIDKKRETNAEVIGFSEKINGRINNFGHKPGVYVNRFRTKLKLKDGKEYFEYTNVLKLVDQEEYKRRIEERERKGKKPEKEFSRNLPDTKFWEGDHVLVYDYSVSRRNRHGLSIETYNMLRNILIKDKEPPRPLMIVGIKWHWKEKWEPWTYRVSNDFFAGLCEYVEEPKIELVKRGNVWKYFHGEKPQFKDIKEEANFFKLLGHYEEIRNPANNLYSWTKEEVLNGIKQGIVDSFSIEASLIGFERMNVIAIRFKDRELGKRVRKATVKGFRLK